MDALANLREAVSKLFAPADTAFRESGSTAEGGTDHNPPPPAGHTVDDDAGWTRLTGDERRDLSPLNQQRMQYISHHLWESESFVRQLIELPISVLLKDTIKLTHPDERLQNILDDFWSRNQMSRLVEQFMRATALNGELILPMFVDSNTGIVNLGYLNPLHIAEYTDRHYPESDQYYETQGHRGVITDPDNAIRQIGIVTRRDRKGRYRKYKTIFLHPDTELFTQRTRQIRAGFTDGDCFYFRLNALPDGTRGRSDLLPLIDILDAFIETQYSETERWRLIKAFIWEVTLNGATPEQVIEKAKEIFVPAPGTVRVTNEHEIWKAVAPDMKAQDSVAFLTWLRNYILGGAGLPPAWFGDPNDTNRATGEVMDEAAFLTLNRRANFWRLNFTEIGQYVLQQAGADRDEWSQVDVEMSALRTKDSAKMATALSAVTGALVVITQNGLLSKSKAAELLKRVADQFGISDYDPEAELDKAKQEKSAEQQQQQQHDYFTAPPSAMDDAPLPTETTSPPETADLTDDEPLPA